MKERQLNASESPLSAQRRPMKERQTNEREAALNSATSDGRVPDEPGLPSKLGDVR